MTEIEIADSDRWIAILDTDICPIPHVLPQDDIYEHMMDDGGSCRCLPYDDGGVLVHNSFDGREAYEERMRRAN